jgi:hypothetical protein
MHLQSCVNHGQLTTVDSVSRLRLDGPCAITRQLQSKRITIKWIWMIVFAVRQMATRSAVSETSWIGCGPTLRLSLAYVPWSPTIARPVKRYACQPLAPDRGRQYRAYGQKFRLGVLRRMTPTYEKGTVVSRDGTAIGYRQLGS